MNQPHTAVHAETPRPIEATPRRLIRADQPLFALLVVAAIAAFLFATLPRGEDWSGDAALYVLKHPARRSPSGIMRAPTASS